jgi:hypothetical protein
MPDLEPVHERLKEILAPYLATLNASSDGPSGMALEIPGLEGKPWGYVAGTRLGKRYVSFYLMPVYALPELDAHVSPALRKRKQGKSCFNFDRIDEALFAELSDLTARTIPGFEVIAREKASAQRSR